MVSSNIKYPEIVMEDGFQRIDAQVKIADKFEVINWENIVTYNSMKS